MATVPTENPAGKTWAEDTEQHLNLAGSEGWEVVMVLKWEDSCAHLLMKRPSLTRAQSQVW